jgi:hypothetical protein
VDHKGRVPRKRCWNRAQKVFLMMKDLLLLMKYWGWLDGGRRGSNWIEFRLYLN